MGFIKIQNEILRFETLRKTFLNLNWNELPFADIFIDSSTRATTFYSHFEMK
jgi:hypothetical protein